MLRTVVLVWQIDCLRGCQPSTICEQRRACALKEFVLLDEAELGAAHASGQGCIEAHTLCSREVVQEDDVVHVGVRSMMKLPLLRCSSECERSSALSSVSTLVAWATIWASVMCAPIAKLD